MRRVLLVLVIVSLTLAAAAAADGGGPSVGVSFGGNGVVSPNGSIRYVAVPGGTDTTIEAIRVADGSVLGWSFVAGQFGVPTLAQDGSIGGLSRDGRTLVLGDATGGTPLRTVSHFIVVDPTRLGFAPHEILLSGDYAFDALSPNGKTLYVIQHVSATDVTRYVVRAYDLQRDRLLPGRIADRTQKSWVMQGYAMTRATSADGRWAYTLYQNPGGYPFIHALDTVRGVAHCIGIPWTGDQNSLYNMRLTLHDGDGRLAVHWRSGRKFVDVDTQTWRVMPVTSSFPWLLAFGGVAAALALAVLVLRVLRRRPTGKLGLAT
jgi:hypothetical protein